MGASVAWNDELASSTKRTQKRSSNASIALQHVQNQPISAGKVEAIGERQVAALSFMNSNGRRATEHAACLNPCGPIGSGASPRVASQRITSPAFPARTR